MGITSADKLAAKTQERSTKIYEALLTKIKAAKLSHEEIQTEAIQLYEDFDWIKGKRIHVDMEASDVSRAPTIKAGKQKISVQVEAQFKD